MQVAGEPVERLAGRSSQEIRWRQAEQVAVEVATDTVDDAGRHPRAGALAGHRSEGGDDETDEQQAQHEPERRSRLVFGDIRDDELEAEGEAREERLLEDK